MSHRITIPVAIACVALACADGQGPVAPTAIAERPVLSNGGQPTPIDVPPYIQPVASAVCGFTVQEAFTGAQKFIELPGGRLVLPSPGLTATITNLDNGRSETLGVTGAFHLTALTNGDAEYVVTGRNLLGFDDSLGQIYVLAIGRFTF